LVKKPRFLAKNVGYVLHIRQNTPPISATFSDFFLPKLCSFY